MTDPPGDALQNQPWPCRRKPSKVLPPLGPQDQRSTKTKPVTGTTPRPLQLLTLYSLCNTIQFYCNYTIQLYWKSVNTLIAWGMFCDAKDTHSHTFTPIIKHLITTTAKKHPGEKSFTEKNMKNPTGTGIKLCISHKTMNGITSPWLFLQPLHLSPSRVN